MSKLRSTRFRLLLPALLALVVVLTTSSAPPPRRSLSGPSTVLWAWERPEDLRFLAGRPVGVAYLARTFYVTGASYSERPRMQPLAVAPDAWVMAVARIEAPPGPIALDEQQTDALAARIAGMAGADRVRAVQIDFDATASQRDFYARLLDRVRRRLPAGTPLSITALVSWCIEDRWVAGLPVDEAVPMLFRMGVGARDAEAFLRTHPGFDGTACAGSLGVSTDERLAAPPSAARTYIFSNAPWTEERWRKQLEATR
jgi:hypothetical protein